MAPDEKALRADLESGRFLAGAARRRWRLIAFDWPLVYISVVARDERGYLLRFDCSGYPHNPATARLWDPDRNVPLEVGLWPKGGGRIAAVFRNDWKGGVALYLPCDRIAIEGHDNWRTEHPSKIWNPSSGIAHYLEVVHELLHCRDYVTRAAS